jgi:WhiB family redox-sensing transcriptional regulator
MLEIKISTWQYNALCRQHSSNLFFPPATFEKKEDREKREAKAKAVCNGCPVKVNCLEEAIGIWGGLNEVERKRNLIFS